MRRFFSILTILTFCLIACQQSTQQAQEKLYAEYYIRYLQEEEQLRAEASFRQGATPEASSPIEFYSVFFDDGAMDLRDLKNRGLRYKSERNGTYSGNFTFKIKEDAETERPYQLAMSTVGGFSLGTPISKSVSVTLNWLGEALQDTEQLVVVIVDKENKAHLIDFAGPTSSSSLIIPKEKFEKIPTGPSKIYLVKKRIQTEDTATQSVKSLIEYYTSTVDFDLMD